jgi:hypothetical protein
MEIYFCNISGTRKMIINNSNTSLNTSLNVSGLTALKGNVDCGGGISITGSNALILEI